VRQRCTLRARLTTLQTLKNSTCTELREFKFERVLSDQALAMARIGYRMTLGVCCLKRNRVNAVGTAFWYDTLGGASHTGCGWTVRSETRNQLRGKTTAGYRIDWIAVRPDPTVNP
jgi:hypothetical protein